VHGFTGCGKTKCLERTWFYRQRKESGALKVHGFAGFGKIRRFERAWLYRLWKNQVL
jgi:hypothetical protein